MCYGLFIKRIVPTPDIRKYKKFLFIAAHAGDVAKAAGGTVNKLAKAGKEIKILITTDSISECPKNADYNEYTERRRKEELASAAVLGVKEVEFLSFRDGETSEEKTEAMAKEIAAIIRKFQPDAVFADDVSTPNELMPGDRITTDAVVKAILSAKNAFESEKTGERKFNVKALALYNTVRPNAYIGVSGALEAKLHAVMMHNSLLPEKNEDKFAYMRSYKSLITLSALRNGLKSGKIFAEGFYAIGGKAMHNMPEINF